MFYWLLLSKQNHMLWMYLLIELNPFSHKLLRRNKIYTLWLHRYTTTSDHLLLSGLHFSCAWITHSCMLSCMLLLGSDVQLPERHARRTGILYSQIFTWVISHMWLLSSLSKLYNHCRRPDEEDRARRLLLLIAFEKSVPPKTTPALKHNIRSS